MVAPHCLQKMKKRSPSSSEISGRAPGATIWSNNYFFFKLNNAISKLSPDYPDCKWWHGQSKSPSDHCPVFAISFFINAAFASSATDGPEPPPAGRPPLLAFALAFAFGAGSPPSSSMTASAFAISASGFSAFAFFAGLTGRSSLGKTRFWLLRLSSLHLIVEKVSALDLWQLKFKDQNLIQKRKTENDSTFGI